MSSVRLSVRPCVCLSVSVTFRYLDHIGWNTSKIISGLISLRCLLGLTRTWRSGPTGTPPKLGWNTGRVMSAKTCISLTVWRTNIGSRICAFDWYQNQWLWWPWTVETSLADNTKIFTESTRKIYTKIAILSAAKCRPLLDSFTYIFAAASMDSLLLTQFLKVEPFEPRNAGTKIHLDMKWRSDKGRSFCNRGRQGIAYRHITGRPLCLKFSKK